MLKSDWQHPLAKAKQGGGKPVLTIPGLGGDDFSMSVLRDYLNDKGFKPYPWLLGRNIPEIKKTTVKQMIDYTEKKEEQLVCRIKEINDETGKKVSLIGWSLGGVFANSLARKYPYLIEQNILLGSPLRSPESTNAWQLFKFLKLLDDSDADKGIEAWNAKSKLSDGQQVYTTAIFSHRDGIVPPSSAIIEEGQYGQNIEVKSSHLGLVYHPSVFNIIAALLSQDPKN